MSYFHSNPKVEWLNTDDDDVPTWKLLEPFVYTSDLLGRDIVVPAGFITDFASVPRAPIVYFLAGNTGNRAAIVHDYLCRLWKEGNFDRRLADDVFEEALKASNVDSWRAKVMYLGVSSYTSALLDPPPEQVYG